MRQFKKVVIVLEISLFIAFGCNTNTNPISANANNNSSLISQSSVVGKWMLSFQWQGDSTQGVDTIVNLADQTAQMIVFGGQFIIPGNTAVNGNQFTWTFSGDGTTWSGIAISNTTISGTMVNSSSGKKGTWTAQESGTIITPNGMAGTWILYFQSQGPLALVVNANQTFQIPGGQVGGPNNTTETGSMSVNCNQVTWALTGNGTWSGIATSSTSVYGELVNASGNTELSHAVKQ